MKVLKRVLLKPSLQPKLTMVLFYSFLCFVLFIRFVFVYFIDLFGLFVVSICSVYLIKQTNLLNRIPAAC